MEKLPDAEVFSLFKAVSSVGTGIHMHDFIGARTRVSYKRAWANYAIPAGKGITPGLPPKNEHYFDWIVILEAVSRARGTFRMAELGAGWAPWTVRAALATRQMLEVDQLELLAIEADPTHYGWMLEHFQDNDLASGHFHLLHGVASGRSETMRFPVISEPDVDYGASLNNAKSNIDTIEVESYTMENIMNKFSGPLDCLHVDIQGAEYDCLPPAMDLLKQQVKLVMIGTHLSDEAHDNLSEQFRGAGWHEMMNLPRNRISPTPWGNIALNDGLLWYSNPDLI
jgi:FkbM family methyltransferase